MSPPGVATLTTGRSLRGVSDSGNSQPVPRLIHGRVRAETNGDAAAPYEAHIRTSAGKELEVLVRKGFEVVEAREHPAHR